MASLYNLSGDDQRIASDPDVGAQLARLDDVSIAAKSFSTEASYS